MLIVPQFLTIAVSISEVIEPFSEAKFPMQFEYGAQEFGLTGADYRTVWGEAVYAMGHYVEPAAGKPNLGAVESLRHYIEASCSKAIMLVGTYDSVPAYGIRWEWKRSLKRQGYRGDNLRSFVKKFRDPFRRGSVLKLIATPSGRLTARQDGQLLGAWDDPELVRAVWSMCLGPGAEVENRMNLARRGHLREGPAGTLDESVRGTVTDLVGE